MQHEPLTLVVSATEKIVAGREMAMDSARWFRAERHTPSGV
jgi:hypothetical protein